MNENSIQITKMRHMIKISFSVSAIIHTDNDLFISHCDALGIYSQGYTKQEAESNIADAIQLFIETCYDEGILETKLKEFGFTMDRSLIIPSIDTPDVEGSFIVDVPISLMVMESVKQAQTV